MDKEDFFFLRFHHRLVNQQENLPNLAYSFKTLQSLISQEDSFDFLDVKKTWAGSAAKPSVVTL